MKRKQSQLSVQPQERSQQSSNAFPLMQAPFCRGTNEDMGPTSEIKSYKTTLLVAP